MNELNENFENLVNQDIRSFQDDFDSTYTDDINLFNTKESIKIDSQNVLQEFIQSLK